MGCITYGCHVYSESKKTGKGCLEIIETDYKKCCASSQGEPQLSAEDSEALKIGNAMFFGQEPFQTKLLNNEKLNLEILKKIKEENNKAREEMKGILDELILRSKNLNKKVIIGTGNSCNNPCYLYNTNLINNCPKCNGKVEEDVENGYTITKEWKPNLNRYEEVKNYNETKICTGFKWNDKIDNWDVQLGALFEHFDKTDNAKKVHWTINVEDKDTKEKKTEEYDIPLHYMVVDGKRFDFPYGLKMLQFFYHNNDYFFPKETGNRYVMIDGVSALKYQHKICFWYELRKKELGQSLGYYGYAWRHMVLIYTCNSCGHKYHIIKVSPFAFRDKSKDAK